jgi:hypothetical protein
VKNNNFDLVKNNNFDLVKNNNFDLVKFDLPTPTRQQRSNKFSGSSFVFRSKGIKNETS